MNKHASDEQLTIQRLDMPKKFHGNSHVKDMTYAISSFVELCILSRDDIKSVVSSTFQSWVVIIQLDLWETNDFEAMKIKIEFIV